MRNISSLSINDFLDSLEKILMSYSEKFLRTSALVDPNFLERYENNIQVNTRNADDLAVLAIWSYYLDTEIGILLRFELKEIIENNSDLDFLEFLLEGKYEMIQYLLQTSKWHTRDFFGNLVTKNRLTRLSKICRFRRRLTGKPQRLVRRRGYKDKGSLKFPHEYHSFSTGTRAMKTLEEERESSKDTYLFLQGFLGTKG